VILIRKLDYWTAENFAPYLRRGNQYLWCEGNVFVVTSYAVFCDVSEILAFPSDSEGNFVDPTEIAGERGVEDVYEEHWRIAARAFRDLAEKDSAKV